MQCSLQCTYIHATQAGAHLLEHTHTYVFVFMSECACCQVYRYVLSTLPAFITPVLVSLVMFRHVYGPRSHANLDTSVVAVLGTYQPVCACQSAQSKYPLSHMSEANNVLLQASLSLIQMSYICCTVSLLVDISSWHMHVC